MTLSVVHAAAGLLLLCTVQCSRALRAVPMLELVCEALDLHEL